MGAVSILAMPRALDVGAGFFQSSAFHPSLAQQPLQLLYEIFAHGDIALGADSENGVAARSASKA